MNLSNGLWTLTVLVAFIAVTYPPLMIAALLLAMAALATGPDDTVVNDGR